MALERYIINELSGIAMTATELSAIAGLIRDEISNPGFAACFSDVVEGVGKNYDVVIDNLLVFFELVDENDFNATFCSNYAAYKETYLLEISKPRSYADAAYESYIELKTFREMKTQYPLLKRTFARFDGLIDKWVTNDAWLPMGIDNLFKRLNNLLNEVAEIKQKDPEDAYRIYRSAFEGFSPYFDIIRSRREALMALRPAETCAA